MHNNRKVRIQLNPSKCIKCERCRDCCPLTRVLGFHSIKDEAARALCIQCGNCMAICPQRAIRIGTLPQPTMAQNIPSSAQAMNLIRARRSIRSFKRQEVPQEKWQQLIEAVKYSPTSHNSQYVDIIIIQDKQIIARLARAGMKMCERMADKVQVPLLERAMRFMIGKNTTSIVRRASPRIDRQREMLRSGSDPILFGAPGIMLFISPAREMLGKNDAGLAAQTVALYAPSIGLGTCYSGLVTAAFAGIHRPIRRLVPVPKGYVVHNALIVGYPKHQYSYVPPRRERNVIYY